MIGCNYTINSIQFVIFHYFDFTDEIKSWGCIKIKRNSNITVKNYTFNKARSSEYEGTIFYHQKSQTSHWSFLTFESCFFENCIGCCICAKIQSNSFETINIQQTRFVNNKQALYIQSNRSVYITNCTLIWSQCQWFLLIQKTTNNLELAFVNANFKKWQKLFQSNSYKR